MYSVVMFDKVYSADCFGVELLIMDISDNWSNNYLVATAGVVPNAEWSFDTDECAT